MKRDTLEEHDRRINGVLRKAYDSHGWVPVDDHTPLEEMLNAEVEFEMDGEAPDGSYAWPSASQPDLELMALKREEAAQVAALAREQLVRWIAGSGVHPFRLVQRFYALCFARYGDLIGPLNGNALAEIMGQGRAAFSATMREIFGKPIEAKLGVSLKVPGQKSAAAKEKYAENAARHKPRQQLNRDQVDEPPAQEQRADAEARVKAAREAWEARQLERDAAAHEAFTRQAKSPTTKTKTKRGPKV